MNKLQCPGCKSEHITVQSRRRYLSWAALCLAIIGVSYLVIRTPLLKPGEWNAAIMALIIASETAFCISIILGVYYLALGIFKRHTTYFCRDCKEVFDNGLAIPHSTSGK
jgi:hypothetical protein